MIFRGNLDIIESRLKLDYTQTILILTNLLVFLYGSEDWYISVPLSIICLLSFIFPKILNSKDTWGLICLLLIFNIFFRWYILDNHKFLILYWCLTIYISFFVQEKEKFIANNAKILIGLVFTLATTWKLLSPNFLNTDFFHWALIVDKRFELFSRLFLNMDIADLTINYNNFQNYLEFSSRNDISKEIFLKDSTYSNLVAHFMTYWTIIIEGFIGIAFLHSRLAKINALKDYALMVFILTTYLFLPVFGFGGTLAIMGFAQADSNNKGVRLLYLLCLVILFLYNIPIENLIYGK